MIYGFTEDGSECIFALGNQTRGAWVYDIDVKIIGGTPYLFRRKNKTRWFLSIL